MKNFKSRILLVFLANLILFNSFGFGLVEHSCSMRGKKSYSFITAESCKGCSNHAKIPTGKASVSKTKCCDDKQIDQNNDSESLLTLAGKFIHSVSKMLAKTVIWVCLTISQAVLEITNHTANQQEPSSLFGTKLLHFISLLRL